MSQKLVIPFHVEMRYMCQREPMLHDLKYHVVGAEDPVWLRVESDGYRHPRIVAHVDHGECDLGWELEDQLALKLFSLMAGKIIELGGQSIRWTFDDIFPWLKGQFPEDVAYKIGEALFPHVDFNIPTSNMLLVADDDAI